MDERTTHLVNAYRVLLEAIAHLEPYPEPIQATEVLGTTGPWLSSLNEQELIELSLQIGYELHRKISDRP
ncbi:MAG: hypothetical protein F6K65_22265 [Moorea sp. SIO3C2]|nr:hypothetical protein [Moorena sp. SIO3C2]